jgi:predicted lysophospholipase L1 biosynthesis ABC-type transport system permease subunit
MRLTLVVLLAVLLAVVGVARAEVRDLFMEKKRG